MTLETTARPPRLPATQAFNNPYLYTGQEWDAELSMYNLRARHYSPTFGRFIALDPIGYAGGSNLFS